MAKTLVKIGTVSLIDTPHGKVKLTYKVGRTWERRWHHFPSKHKWDQFKDLWVSLAAPWTLLYCARQNKFFPMPKAGE